MDARTGGGPGRAGLTGQTRRWARGLAGAVPRAVLLVLLLVAPLVPAVLLLPASASAAAQSIPDVKYGSASLENMTIYPASKAGAHLVVVVHGGGWATESATYFASQAAALQAAGFAVFNINYRLDSKTVAAFPMETYDVSLAIHWAIAHAATYHADPTHVSLVGGSAGGELVAWAAETLPPGTIRDVVTLSGAFDFAKLVNDGNAGTENHDLAVSGAQALGCTLSTCTAPTEAQWSPADHLTATNCPPKWYLINSSNELMPMDQPTEMTQVLQSKKCTVLERIVPGTSHSIGYWSTVSPQVISFVRTNG